MEKNKKYSVQFKASIWFAMSNILRKIIVYISMPIFTRLMTTEQYGIYTLYCSWSEIIFLFTTLSISVNIYNKCVIKFKKDIWKFTSSILCVPLIFSMIILLIVITLKKSVYQIIQLPIELIVLILLDSIFTPAFNYWAINERFDYKYKKIVILSLLQTVLNPILGFFMLKYINNSGIIRCLSIVVANLIVNVPIFIMIIYKGKCLFNWKNFRYVLVNSVSLLPHYLSQVLLNQMDRIMIGNLCGVNYSAIYSIAYSVSLASLIINRAINDAFVPWLYNGLAKRKLKDISKTVNVLLICIALMNYLVILIGPEIVHILGPREYYKAIWIIPPVALSSYLLFLYSLFCNIEFYFEVNKYMTVVSVLVALINYVTNLYFIKRVGFIAAGYTTLFCYMLFASLHFIVMKKTLKENNLNEIYDHNFIIKITILTLLIGMFTIILYKFQWIRYCLIFVGLLVILFKRKLIFQYLEKLWKR